VTIIFEGAVMRALATIRQVHTIEAIPNADAIELAKIDGWQCVVKKGEFKPGDTGVYFEIDSMLPIEDRYEFLRKSSYKKLPELEGRVCEGFRLKTIKLRGALSQGLLMPLSAFPELVSETVGSDVTTKLCVVLYEPPIEASLQGIVKGNFPSFIRKTDSDRIQNHLDYFEKYIDIFWEVTEKVDGTSMTVYFNNNVFGVCSRNMEFMLETDNAYIKMAKQLELEKLMRAYGQNIAIQGELAGEGIQGNPLKIGGHHFFVFDVWDIERQELMPAEKRYDTLKCIGDLECVPIINHISLCGKTVAEILAMADGHSLINQQKEREGLVFKAVTEINALSFKAISNKYLLSGK